MNSSIIVLRMLILIFRWIWPSNHGVTIVQPHAAVCGPVLPLPPSTATRCVRLLARTPPSDACPIAFACSFEHSCHHILLLLYSCGVPVCFSRCDCMLRIHWWNVCRPATNTTTTAASNPTTATVATTTFSAFTIIAETIESQQLLRIERSRVCPPQYLNHLCLPTPLIS